MISARDKEGEALVITLHPKLVDRWAKRYIQIYQEEGRVYAKRWASEFLPKEAQEVMSERVKEIMGRTKRTPK